MVLIQKRVNNKFCSLGRHRRVSTEFLDNEHYLPEEYDPSTKSKIYTKILQFAGELQ